MAALNLFNKQGKQRGEDFDYEQESEQPVYPEQEETVYDAPAAPARSAGFTGGGYSSQMKILHPKSYAEGENIASYVRGGSLVVMSFDSISQEDAFKLEYFLRGVACAVDGKFSQVSDNTYVLSPNSMEVFEEEEARDEGVPDNNYGFNGFDYSNYVNY